MRLNKELRTKIVENAYKASPIPEAKKALTARSMALAEKIRLASFKDSVDLSDNFLALEAEFRALVKRRGIPEIYKPSYIIFDRNHGTYANLGENNVFIRLNGRIEENRRVLVDSGDCPAKFIGKDGNLDYEADHEFTQEYRSIINDAKDLKTQAEVLLNTVQAAVDSFTTVEKLVEHWPECAPLIPKEVSAASQPMPIALQTDTLNKLIGLPK